MREIRIQFTRPLKAFPVFSWVIRWFQKTEYSHVRLCWLGAAGSVPVIYEASGSNIKFIGPVAASENKVEVIREYVFRIEKEDYKRLVILCMTYASVEYGKIQILGMALAYMFDLKKNPFSVGRKSQVCSEVVGVFLSEILGWKLDIDLDIAGPKEIQETIEKHQFLNKDGQE